MAYLVDVNFRLNCRNIHKFVTNLWRFDSYTYKWIQKHSSCNIQSMSFAIKYDFADISTLVSLVENISQVEASNWYTFNSVCGDTVEMLLLIQTQIWWKCYLLAVLFVVDLFYLFLFIQFPTWNTFNLKSSLLKALLTEYALHTCITFVNGYCSIAYLCIQTNVQ